MTLRTAQYAAKFKRNDSFVTLHNFAGVFSLHSCIQLPQTNDLLFIFNRFHVRSLHATTSEIQCNLLQHVWKASATGSLVACRASDIGLKCVGIKNVKGILHCIVLPFFELD